MLFASAYDKSVIIVGFRLSWQILILRKNFLNALFNRSSLGYLSIFD